MGQVNSAPKTDMQNLEGNICMVTEHVWNMQKSMTKKIETNEVHIKHKLAFISLVGRRLMKKNLLLGKHEM